MAPQVVDQACGSAAEEVKEIDDDHVWSHRSAYWANVPAPRPQVRSKKSPQNGPLILTGHGVRLRVDHGALLVRNGFTHYPQRREEWRFFPGDWRTPSRIVVLDGDGGLSFDVLAWLSAQQIPLVRIDWRGAIVVVAGGTGYAIDRSLAEAQLRARENGAWLRLCRRLIAEKIDNSIETLRLVFGESPAVERALQKLSRDAEAMQINPPSTVAGLLGIEGRAAAAYFAAWHSYPLRWKGTTRHPIPDDWRRIGWRSSRASRRNHPNRNAEHPVNAMLNYAYAVLESEVRVQIVAAGLDPTIGYLHGSYGNKQTLVFDLMEPLRPVIDRAILAVVQNHIFSPGDFTITNSGVCRLNPQLALAVVRGVAVLPERSALVQSVASELMTEFASSERADSRNLLHSTTWK